MPDTALEVRADLPVLTFPDQETFAAWLTAQPQDSKDLWLRLAKIGAKFASVSKPEAVDAALCHGQVDGQLNRYVETIWLTRFTP